ncbi:MAG: hypothetical protein ACR2N4_14915 [Jatrophihabitans sp.]
MEVVELRRWIEDALARHARDVQERGEPVAEVSAAEIVDAVWGRLPLEVRRQASRAQVQASLTMLSVRQRFGSAGSGPAAPAQLGGGPAPASGRSEEA